MYQIQGYTQEEIAKKLKISQSAVFQRLRTSGAWAVRAFLERYEAIIQYKVSDRELDEIAACEECLC